MSVNDNLICLIIQLLVSAYFGRFLGAHTVWQLKLRPESLCRIFDGLLLTGGFTAVVLKKII